MLSGARLLETCLLNHCCCSCATLILLPPFVCRPLCFSNSLSWRLHLLSRYCTPLVQLIDLLPGGLPPPLRRRLRLSSRLPICLLLRCVASRCLVPWPSPPFSSHLCLSLRPSCLIGGCIVLPGAPASLSARSVGLSSCSRLLLRRHAPLLMQRVYSTPPPLTCHLALLNDLNWQVNGGILQKRMPFGCIIALKWRRLQKNNNWQSSLHIQLNSTCSDDR